MLNKKKIGLGMILVGGVVAIAGTVITGKAIKKERVMDEMIEDDFSNFVDDKISECDDCSAVNEKDSLSESLYKLEPTVENVIEARKSTSTYNPHAMPVSINQAELESMADTF